MTNNKVNTQDIPTITRLCSFERGKGAIPEFIIEQIEPAKIYNTPYTIYDAEALQNDETQANDDSNSKEKSCSSVKLTACVAVQPPSKERTILS